LAVTDSDEALRYIAGLLDDLRRRYRRDGFHWSPELESVRLLARGGHGRSTLDGGAEIGDCLAMSYDVAARRLSVSERTVRRLVESGELPRIDIGGCKRIATEDLAAYVMGTRQERIA
jgi:excisionase family DNA binding protein